MNNWKPDKNWSDKFLPEIKSILGSYLIGEPEPDEDAQRNTDLIVLKMEAVRIGCRIRRYKFLASYGEEFTIRSSRPSGMKTELAKIIEGWGDYFFYGFSNQEETCLAAYFLGDMNVFRLWFNSRIVRDKGCIPAINKANTDNSSGFYIFRVADLPANFIIGRKLAARIGCK
jgi:hypothetical protein|tara:strand:- start:2180 stop:2695 length:516 start_codon:yes stop_codon:yes gene_type:complete